MNFFDLEILTPYGKYLKAEATFVSLRSEKYSLGILPGHADLISTISICPLNITFVGGQEECYAIAGGIIKVEGNKVTLLLDSIERKDEIDYQRALDSSKRARKRLDSQDASIDMTRAKKAYARAMNRLTVLGKV